MKNMLMIAMLAIACAPSFVAAAQTDKPAANTAAPAPVMGKMAEPGPVHMASRSNVDARECLRFETNVEIRICAEKFR